MARTDSKWDEKGGSYIQTIWAAGRNILINGLNKYLNFNAVSGETGYGFRDNNGVIEVKNSGGAWNAIGQAELAATFEIVNKNLSSYAYVLNYDGSGILQTIVYTHGSGTITKTFGYTSGKLTSVTLSGDLPSGLPDVTKTLSYTGDLITGITYS